MKKLTTTVTYKVPKGLYCNHSMQKSTHSTRCRFCTDLGKGRFTCVLHNMPLDLMEGILIYKTDACLAQQGTVEDTPTLPPKEVAKYALKEYRKLYLSLIKQGYPEEMAHKAAQEGVIK